MGITPSSIILPLQPVLGSARFSGMKGQGPINVPGMLPGDIIFSVILATGDSATYYGVTDFEVVVSAKDQIQQMVAQDLTNLNFIALFYRGA